MVQTNRPTKKAKQKHKSRTGRKEMSGGEEVTEQDEGTPEWHTRDVILPG